MLQPIWAPGKPAHFGERYFAYSPKLRRSVAVSSKLEFEQLLLLEFDPNVANYCEQPTIAEVVVGRRVLRSRLDFWVLSVSGDEQFIEVKYTSDLRDPNSRAHKQLAIQREWCRAHGHRHAVVTDSQIWAQPTRINSFKTLLHEYTVRFPETVGMAERIMPEIERLVERRPEIRIAQVLAECPRGTPSGIWRLAAMELIRRGRVDAALGRVALSPLSPMRLTDGGIK